MCGSAVHIAGVGYESAVHIAGVGYESAVHIAGVGYAGVWVSCAYSWSGL